MLRLEKLNMVDNGFTSEEVAKLRGTAVLKNGTTSETLATGGFHMTNAGCGNVSANIGLAGKVDAAGVTVTKAADLAVKLQSVVKRTFVVPKGATEIKTGLKGAKSAVGDHNGTTVSVTSTDDGVLTIAADYDNYRMIDFDITVDVASGTLEAPSVAADQKLVIMPDNAAGKIYVDIVTNAIAACCKKLNATHVTVRGAKPWNNVGEAQIVELKLD